MVLPTLVFQQLFSFLEQPADVADVLHDRRIYTGGRPWPRNVEPSFAGYSIGTWRDEFGNGRFDVLNVETRALRGPLQFRRTA